jgi:hypothetical protein
LAEYDNIIIGYAKDCYRPAEIADRLQDEHGLSPAIANHAAVERRIRYLKKNKLAELPPTNDAGTLQAKPNTCFFTSSFFPFPFVNIFNHCNYSTGQTARVIAETLMEPGDDEDDDDEDLEDDTKDSEEEQNEQFQKVQQGVFDILLNTGLFWTLETNTQFILLFSRSLCMKVQVSDPQKNGVFVTFSLDGPTDVDLTALHHLVGLPIHELQFNKKSEDIFIPSSRDLDTDASLIKREVIGEPTKCWLAVSIPYYGEKEHNIATLDEFDPTQ